MSRSLWSLLPESLSVRFNMHQVQFEAFKITGLSSDSRAVVQGDLFIALSGVHVDGRQYVPQALNAGAVLAIAQTRLGESVGFDECAGLFLVDSVADIAGAIASEFYDNPSQHLDLVGITGTNGKTTTSYFIASLAQAMGIPSAVMGTNGYGPIDALRPQSLTTPSVIQVHRQLAELRDLGVQLVAMEVSSHALVQKRVAGCRLRIGVLTNISRDHLDYHGNFESYIAAKQLLFAKQDLEYAIVNADDMYAADFLRVAVEAHRLAYSTSQDHIAQLNCDGGFFEVLCSQTETTMQMFFGQEACVFHPQLIGDFNFSNLAAANLVLHSLGHAPACLAKAVPFLQMPEGRMHSIRMHQCPQIIIDFAHTPDAVRTVLSALKPIVVISGGRLIVVFGCGGDRDRGKRPLMAIEVQQKSDVAIVTSDNVRNESIEQIYSDIVQGFCVDSACEVMRCDNRAEAIKKAIEMASSSDVVVILGKGHEKYQEVLGCRHVFDDVAEASKVLKKRTDRESQY